MINLPAAAEASETSLHAASSSSSSATFSTPLIISWPTKQQNAPPTSPLPYLYLSKTPRQVLTFQKNNPKSYWKNKNWWQKKNKKKKKKRLVSSTLSFALLPLLAYGIKGRNTSSSGGGLEWPGEWFGSTSRWKLGATSTIKNLIFYDKIFSSLNIKFLLSKILVTKIFVAKIL